MTRWATVQLGEICEFKYGKSLPAGRRESGKFPVYGSNGVVGHHSVPLTTGRTIVVGRKGSFGEVHLAEGPCWPIDTTYYVDASCTSVDLNWLAHVLPSCRLTELNRAAAIPGLNREDAYRRRLLLPPLDEQRRIAAILDQANALCAKRHRTLAYLDEFAESLFLELTGPEGIRAVTTRAGRSHKGGWEWVLLTDVARLATGHTPDRKKSEYWDGEIPWISLPEIRRLDGRTALDTKIKTTSAGIANSSAVVLPAGTVCFSRTASVGFVTKLGCPMATSQDFHNWVPGPELNPEYLMSALRVSRQHLLAASDGSIHKTIYQRVAESFRVLLPPRELQDDFARRLAMLDAVRHRMLAAQTCLMSTSRSLADRAFAGEL